MGAGDPGPRWHRGRGDRCRRARIEADPLTFTLVASGRADPTILQLDPTVNIYG